MSFFAVLFALVIEQVRPLPRDNWIHDGLVSWVSWVGRNFDAGRKQHALVVWCICVLTPPVLACLAFLVIEQFSAPLGLAFNVLMLYLTLGFRQFSHYFTDIREAMDRGDEAQARRVLSQWCQLDASELPRTELLRHVIEHALLAGHRHVFGVFFCFLALSAVGLGPAGAVAYRMAELASRRWAHRGRALDAPADLRLMQLSQQMFGAIDHVPARLTAFGFAVVGNFEEAVNGWRRDTGLWPHPNEGCLLAAAAGAIGVQLGGSTVPGTTPDRPTASALGGGPEAATPQGTTAGAPAQVAHLASVVGLVWRSVVLWMLLAALLSLANLLG